MIIETTIDWEDYELMDCGDGRKLERFGKFILDRPDPQVMWQKRLSKEVWDRSDAVFEISSQDSGHWVKKTAMPEKWKMAYQDLTFWLKLTPFKHTGVFPEQSQHWKWLSSLLQNRGGQPKVLNLFAYTGISSLVAAANGAYVTHVDASSQSITWANENQLKSTLGDKPIRWILDDALKFLNREIKRGNKYDGIIMDPPIYGHGPHGERWDFKHDFPGLVKLCSSLLSNNPLFMIVSAYATTDSALTIGNVLEDYTKNLRGKIEAGELTIKEKSSDRLLSAGIFGRWSNST